MYYLDTSVLAALYIPEIKSNKIQELIKGKGETAISSLTRVELHSAVSRRIRMKEISMEDGNRILSYFQLHIKNKIYRNFPIMEKDYELAQNWIGNFQTPLRTLDALHLAVAFSNNLELVTSDILLAESGNRLGIKIIKI